MANQPAIPVENKWPRVTIFYQSSFSTISETHWYTTAGDYNAALAAGQLLVSARIPTLPTTAYPLEVRVSLEKVYRDSTVFGYNYFQNVGPLTDFASPDDSLGVRFEGTPLYRRIAYLGFVPAAAIREGAYVPGLYPAYDQALRSYLATVGGFANLPNTKWGFLTLNKDPAVNPRVNILSSLGAGNSRAWQITCQAAPLVAIGDVVRVSGVKQQSGVPTMNRLFTVTAVAGNVVTVDFNSVVQDPIVTGPGGLLQRQTKIFQQYTSAAADDLRNKKRGFRTFLPRGRSLKKTPVVY